MFELVREDIYSVFASNAWQTLGYTVYPRSFQGLVAAPYILLSILPGTKDPISTDRKKKLNGLMILTIFTDTMTGDKQLFQIAEVLNTFFEDKQFPNGTKFGFSGLKPIGTEQDNTSLYRGDYSIQFNLYGD